MTIEPRLTYSATYETYTYLINGYEFEESFETGKSLWSAPNQGTQDLLKQQETEATIEQILDNLRIGNFLKYQSKLVAHEIHNVDVIRINDSVYKRVGVLIQEGDAYIKVQNRWLYYNKSFWGWTQIPDIREQQDLETYLYELKHDLNNS